MLKNISWIRKQFLWCYYQIAQIQAEKGEKPNWLVSFLGMSMILFAPGAMGVIILMDVILFGGGLRLGLSKIEYFEFRGSVNAFVVFLGFLPGFIASYFTCVYHVDNKQLILECSPLRGGKEWSRLVLIFLSGGFLFVITLVIAISISM